jgi:hypothetical protein
MANKLLFLFLIMIMMISVFSGVCFAAGDMSVVVDTNYPDWGFRSHSWITESGIINMEAHTQIIDLKTNNVIYQVDNKCNYVFSL